MHYDPDNKVVKLCAAGMKCEGEGNKEEASRLFLTAWEESTDDVEKFTAAHYVARHQQSVADKLDWDVLALHFALKVKDEGVKEVFPSLYLNLAKGYEDLKDYSSAKNYYQLALSFTDQLVADGYGAMLSKGITEGMKRVTQPISTE